MNDNPKISASKTFSPESAFDLSQILEHAKNRTDAIDEKGNFTQSIRIIAEIDDSEFLPKTSKVVLSKKQLIVSEEEDDEPIIVNNPIVNQDDEDNNYHEKQSEESEVNQISLENESEDNVDSEEKQIIYVLDEQPSDENQFVDKQEHDEDFGVITPTSTKLPKRKKK